MNIHTAAVAIAFAVLSCNAGAIGSFADVTVYDRAENRVLPVYYHAGRYYVAGTPGNEYQLTIRNQQPGDIMTVVSVDGINAVSGETADWNQTGYVFGPNTGYSIKGWRKSLQRVARFFFTALDDSYAARTGRPANVGVIGIAVFRRKSEPAISLGRMSEDKRDAGRDSAPRAEVQGAPAERAAGNAAEATRGAAASPPQAADKALGTGHGASETAPVRYTGFERASSSPDEVITIYYDSYRNLLAQGVIRAPNLARPTPFPGQFVPDPR